MIYRRSPTLMIVMIKFHIQKKNQNLKIIKSWFDMSKNFLIQINFRYMIEENLIICWERICNNVINYNYVLELKKLINSHNYTYNDYFAVNLN